jgi:hypothetical protein
MNALRRFGLFWYDFVVGDDWLLGVGAVAGLVVAALLAHAGSPAAWVVLPVVVIATMVGSVRRALPRSRPDDTAS